MKSGLEGRNNVSTPLASVVCDMVSMKSGLEGRNNPRRRPRRNDTHPGLNEVRPRRPEQRRFRVGVARYPAVSMKSGLEGRNKLACEMALREAGIVSMKSGLEGRNNDPSLG